MVIMARGGKMAAPMKFTQVDRNNHPRQRPLILVIRIMVYLYQSKQVIHWPYHVTVSLEYIADSSFMLVEVIPDQVLVLEKRLSRQLFLRILTAHDCASKFTCHVMHRARAPSAKMNNNRADGHCHSFAWIWRSWTVSDLNFSFQKQILCTIISTLFKNEQKNRCGTLKKIQDFCPRSMESWHLTAARHMKLWSLNSNLFFEES